ncbi:flagellin [Paraburkholderia sp. SARCC-3016]|uniref:flagellin N-terminal helical domain-containing protein n=1 Tax=Paraburkholderia sp. SARCC-3016 TaxID=3058611 RepID=UPI002807A987|nr:flagellin [Paraburkholderia sp. SARCC-3016]MDQ7980981.1 flagellin [Paraburkholderia sp. SARCC-3016]
MLSINSNIPSLVAQENLNASGSALSQAITRLSSGKRINSAADDAAGLAISTSLQTQINGLSQGVSNANNGVSLVQTASTGLSQITASLQRIRQLAGEAAGGTLTPANQAALQQEVKQQESEINRIASQTQFNGIGLLNGQAGIVNVQVGANVGQTVALDLSQGVSAASIGGGVVAAGNTLGTISGLNLTASGAVNTSGNPGAITSINIISNGSGGFTFEDQNGDAISSAASAALFTTTTTNGVSSLSVLGTGALSPTTELTAISSVVAAGGTNAASGTVFGTISGINVDPTTGSNAAADTPNAVTSINIESNGSGGVKFVDQNGNQLSASAAGALFNVTSANGVVSGIAFVGGAPTSTIGSAVAGAQPAGSALANINSLNVPTAVSQIDVSTTLGANNALLSIDNALATINNIQASLGAAQNRFTAISQSQQNESTDLSSAQSQITDADFAATTASLSSAQVLQQAGIAVLATANAQPQQVLKLLQ